jgi:hypothetical protein
LCTYYDVGNAHHAAWSYPDAYPGVGRISNLVPFEPDMVSVLLDGTQLRLEPGQTVIAHGADRDLTLAEAPPANDDHARAPSGGAP